MSDQTATLPGERGVSPVGGSRPGLNRWHVTTMAALGLGAFAVWVLLHHPAKRTDSADKQLTISQLNEFQPAKDVTPPPVPPPMPLTQPTAPMPAVSTVMPQMTSDPLDKAREMPPLGGTQQQQAQATEAPKLAATAPGDPGESGATGQGSLADRLQPTLLSGSRATVLAHPAMTITEGTPIPCTLNTALDSTAPGFVTCTTTQDIRGTTGTVTLLDRGTKIFGEYRTNVQQGQSRIFVLWDRAETPEHVIITLASPGTDSLGRSGFEGEVDTHWMQRFGNALLFSLIDSGFSALPSILSSHGGNNYLQFGSAQSSADTILQSSINIAPTIRVNQGASVSVMVARDLSFENVYSLQLRDGR